MVWCFLPLLRRSVNKKHIDPVAKRFTAITAGAKVKLTLTSGEGRPEAGTADFRSLPLHPKTAELGTKAVPFASTLWLEQEDVENFAGTCSTLLFNTLPNVNRDSTCNRPLLGV